MNESPSPSTGYASSVPSLQNPSPQPNSKFSKSDQTPQGIISPVMRTHSRSPPRRASPHRKPPASPKKHRQKDKEKEKDKDKTKDSTSPNRSHQNHENPKNSMKESPIVNDDILPTNLEEYRSEV